MSAHLQLVIGLWFASICGIAAMGFTCWILWSLGWELYDHFLQKRTRNRLRRFDARVGRDCYRFTKGVHR